MTEHPSAGPNGPTVGDKRPSTDREASRLAELTTDRGGNTDEQANESATGSASANAAFETARLDSGS